MFDIVKKVAVGRVLKATSETGKFDKTDFINTLIHCLCVGALAGIAEFSVHSTEFDFGVWTAIAIPLISTGVVALTNLIKSKDPKPHD